MSNNLGVSAGLGRTAEIWCKGFVSPILPGFTLLFRHLSRYGLHPDSAAAAAAAASGGRNGVLV